MVSDERAPDIAVIVPTRNRKHVLRRAIDSVFAQKHQNFELIVVDDFSTDDTVGYLASVADPRFKWHRFDEWRRGNAARNHAVAMSRAPLLSFLDSDDHYLPDRLENDLESFSRCPGVDVRISSFTSVTGSGAVPRVNPEAVLRREELELYLVGYCLYLGGSGISMRRRAFDEVGGFDETLGRMQDRDLLLRVARTRGCGSASKIDWVKHRSWDSLSDDPVGRIDALAELGRRHPDLRRRYPELVRYLVAREIVTPLFQTRLRQAGRSLSEARRNPDLDVALVRLIPDYLRGRRRRRELMEEISRRYGARTA
jgi:glycosyltransferase involved in cell wall biosynthesis